MSPSTTVTTTRVRAGSWRAGEAVRRPGGRGAVAGGRVPPAPPGRRAAHSAMRPPQTPYQARPLERTLGQAGHRRDANLASSARRAERQGPQRSTLAAASRSTASAKIGVAGLSRPCSGRTTRRSGGAARRPRRVLERARELLDVLVERRGDVHRVAEVVEVQRALLAELRREDRQHALADHRRLDHRRRVDPTTAALWESVSKKSSCSSVEHRPLGVRARSRRSSKR